MSILRPIRTAMDGEVGRGRLIPTCVLMPTTDLVNDFRQFARGCFAEFMKEVAGRSVSTAGSTASRTDSNANGEGGSENSGKKTNSDSKIPAALFLAPLRLGVEGALALLPKDFTDVIQLYKDQFMFDIYTAFPDGRSGGEMSGVQGRGISSVFLFYVSSK